MPRAAHLLLPRLPRRPHPPSRRHPRRPVATVLNQYGGRRNPGTLHILGAAHPDAVVHARLAHTPPSAAVDASRDVVPTDRSGGFWHAAVAVDNASGPVGVGVDAHAFLPAAGPNGEDVAAPVESRTFEVPQRDQDFAHDADGNLVADGRFAYAWDAESRLVLASNDAVAVSFAYDHRGRRIGRKHYRWDTDHWSLVTDHSFLYDGWHLVAEYTHTPAPPNSHTNYYTWGLDRSGSLQGAGGVGGLLAVATSAANPSNLPPCNLATFFPVFDANGNVTDYVGTNGEAAASFEYSPFGEVVAETVGAGLDPSAFAFRFSTKPLDPVLGLYDFGLRWYCAATGRWLSRDPIAEAGGWNLYAFCGNDGVNCVDPFGLDSIALAALSGFVKGFCDGAAVMLDHVSGGRVGHERAAEAECEARLYEDVGRQLSYGLGKLGAEAAAMLAVAQVAKIPQVARALEWLGTASGATQYLAAHPQVVAGALEVAGAVAAATAGATAVDAYNKASEGDYGGAVLGAGRTLIAGVAARDAYRAATRIAAAAAAGRDLAGSVRQPSADPGLDSGRASVPDSTVSGAPAGGGTAAPAAESGASNRALHEKYLDQLRRRMSKPHTTNPELTNLMDDLYRPGAKVGSGSTADAVRHELTTGELVGGRTHITKAQEYSAALQDWLKANPTASGVDRAAAENVLRDLSSALGGD